MNAFCYICNNQSTDYCRNFAEIKSQHTQTPIADFVKSILADFHSMRNIDDESNCICTDCLNKIDDYDWTCQQAIEQEAKLRHLLLTTELTLRKVNAASIEIKKEIEDGLNEGDSISGTRDLLSECDIKLEPDDGADTDVMSIQWSIPSPPPLILTTSNPTSVSLMPALQPNTMGTPTMPVLLSESNSEQNHYIIQQHGQQFKVMLANPESQTQTSDAVLPNASGICDAPTKTINSKAISSTLRTTNQPLKPKHTIETTELELKYVKPTYPYSCLIAMALNNSRTGSLLVTEIYDFMCTHFPYFRTATVGWKSSVRHVLSSIKGFEKNELKLVKPNRRSKCLWYMDQKKTNNMNIEITKWLRKDPEINRMAMDQPDKLPAILSGKLKHGGWHENSTELNNTAVKNIDPEKDATNLIDDLFGNEKQPMAKRPRTDAKSIEKN